MPSVPQEWPAANGQSGGQSGGQPGGQPSGQASGQTSGLAAASGSPADLPLGAGGDRPTLTPAAIAEAEDWLAFHRLWGSLSDAAIAAIAAKLCQLRVDPETELYRAGQGAIGLYWLKWGTVEIYRQSPVGRMLIRYRNTGELFGYSPLLSEGAVTYQASAITLTRCEIWLLRRSEFADLVQTYPGIAILLNRLLAEDVGHFTQRLVHEQVRIQGLQDVIQPIPEPLTLLGESKPARKLGQQAIVAAADLKPILLQGATGTGKSFVAAYIHGNSRLRQYPWAEIDCAALPRSTTGEVISDRLFGQTEGPAGVLELLERGTVLIENGHLLTTTDRDRLWAYGRSGQFPRNASPTQRPGPLAPVTAQSAVRLIVTYPPSVGAIAPPDLPHHSIKLFRLSQRKADIPIFAEFFLAQFCRDRLLLNLDVGDLRRLVSYPYPGNVSELASILERAVIMTPPDQSVIPEQVLWSVESNQNAFRIDLLNELPWLRRFLLSWWWPEGIWILVMVLFVPVTVMGFLGPQTRESSMTLNFFWAWWWPMYLALFAFVGRVWCAVCPFMITGEWLRRLSLWVWPRSQLSWPTPWLNQWGAWALFAGFVAIYLWEHIWDLPHHADLSTWLLLIITAGAVIGSLIYERRVWCRYLCPIGGMNGMFAKLSMVELRSTQQVCGSQCSTFGCYRGSPATPATFAQALPTEGQATEGCPLYSHPAQLHDNRDCVLCMTCLKACPHRSVQVNLRFPAADLLEQHRGFWAEVALLLLLFGGVFMHHDRQILTWLGWPQVPIDADHWLLALPVVTALLAIPAVMIGATHAIARWSDREQPGFVEVAYAYLPLALAANLADYLPAGLMEAGQILPVIARTLGGTGAGLPTLTWSMDVADFLQGVTLLLAIGCSIYPLQRITQRPWWRNWPHWLLLFGFVVILFRLL
jgi:polyferredoxin/CRP-like cAMP-binding protein